MQIIGISVDIHTPCFISEIKDFIFSSHEFYTDVVSCLEEVLNRTKIHDVKVSQDIFTVLCLLVSSPDQGKGNPKLDWIF